MSDSNQGILFWGFVFHDRRNGPFWEGLVDEEWEPTVAKRLNFKKKDPHDFRAFFNFLKAEGILIYRVGDTVTGEDLVLVLAAQESFHQTWGVDKVQIQPREGIYLEWKRRLHVFCDKVGIPWQNPDWHLAAFYG